MLALTSCSRVTADTEAPGKCSASTTLRLKSMEDLGVQLSGGRSKKMVGTIVAIYGVGRQWVLDVCLVRKYAEQTKLSAVESDTETLEDILLELINTRQSERQGRKIDTESTGSMEKKKGEIL